MAQARYRASGSRAKSGSKRSIGRSTGRLHLQSGSQQGGKRRMAVSCPEPAARHEATIDAAVTRAVTCLEMYGEGQGDWRKKH
jgi:hypothetical protein